MQTHSTVLAILWIPHKMVPIMIYILPIRVVFHQVFHSSQYQQKYCFSNNLKCIASSFSLLLHKVPVSVSGLVEKGRVARKKKRKSPNKLNTLYVLTFVPFSVMCQNLFSL